MSDTVRAGTEPRPPWHLWLVGILAVLWNGSGAYTIMLAQQGMLADISADEAAYYAAQHSWFVLATDIALFGGILGGVALLMRHRAAVVLFAVSLVAIAITNGYDLAMGTSRMFTNTATIVVTGLIWLLAILQLWYAATMRRRGVLR